MNFLFALQSDFFSYIEQNQETILNLNCKLEEIQTEQIQILENRISQLLERIEKLEKFVTGSKPDYYPVITRDIIEDKD